MKKETIQSTFLWVGIILIIFAVYGLVQTARFNPEANNPGTGNPQDEYIVYENSEEEITDSCNDDECYMLNAYNTNNIGLCQKIIDPVIQRDCLTNINNTINIRNAVLAGDVSFCESIENINVRNECSDNFYYHQRVNSQNIAYCDEIINNATKAQCYEETQ